MFDIVSIPTQLSQLFAPTLLGGMMYAMQVFSSQFE